MVLLEQRRNPTSPTLRHPFSSSGRAFMATQEYRLTPIGDIEGLAWISPPTMHDARGWLSELYSRDAFLALRLPEFIHEIASRTKTRGVVRGLHFQTPPMNQAKLFRVVKGRARIAVLDLRSENFGAWATVDAGPDDPWIYIPDHLAQGFQALQDDVEVVFKCSKTFAPNNLGQIAWDDPDLPWSLTPPGSLRSERDALSLPLFSWKGVF